jgi:3-oxoacyl-[acyl-carrier protein] reductase
MYMGQVGTSAESGVRGELSRARILVTGFTANDGVEVARSFAQSRSRLIVHTSDPSPELIDVIAALTRSAGALRLHTHDISTADSAAAFAQCSAQAYGGLDAAINIASVSHAEMDAVRSDKDLDALITSKLAPLAQLTRVIANRMSIVLSEGLILNVFEMPLPLSRRERAVATFARTALASMTVSEARAWARHGIRVNAVGPNVGLDGRTTETHRTSEADVAELALYLASADGRSHSGHVFDADEFAWS